MSGQPDAQRVRLERGPWPLSLPRVVARAAVTCSQCQATQDLDVLASADWWDQEGLRIQREHATGLTCPDCGASISLPVPLIQHRDLDAIELLIGLPMTTTSDQDRQWIRETMSVLKPYVSSARAVCIRATWWSALCDVPLGPVLTGLEPVPHFSEADQERQAWIEATRASLELPDVVAALARFMSAGAPTQARSVFDSEPALADLRWRSTVELAGRRLLAVQESDDQRQVVAQRLSRLRQMAVNVEPDGTGEALTDAARRAVDEAVALPVDHPERVVVIREAVEVLRPAGPSRLLGAALTTLLATQMAAPQRSPGQWRELVALGGEAIDVCQQVFGEEHEASVTNVLNMLLLHQERPGATTEEVAAVCAAYEGLTQSQAIRRTGHVVDVLNNLAAALDLRTDLSRGERLELTLALFETVEHVTRLVQPADVRTQILSLVNQAAVLRQRLVGPRLRNLERGWDLLTRAGRLAQENGVLRSTEKVQLLANKLNLAYSLYQATQEPAQSQRVVSAVRAAVDAIAILDDDNEIAITTLLNTGSVLVDLHVEACRAGYHRPGLLEEAEALLTSAADRCRRLFPAGQRTRLTALLNLAAVYGAPTGTAVKDAAIAADLYRQVAREAEGRSLDHIATAMTNLGTLAIGQGQWVEAAEAYAKARHARAELVAQTAGRHTRLGEVIASGDLAAREALAYVRLKQLDDAVRALEDSRATLLRHRFKITSHVEPPHCPGRTIVHLASCTFGTIAIVHPQARPRVAAYSSLSSTAVRTVVTPLLNARARIERILAFDQVEASLRGLVDTVTALIPDETTELCVVACGPLAGAPLHALAAGDGTTWLERWPVRYWPSGVVAARTPEPDTSKVTRVIAVASQNGDLPLTASEIEAVASFCSNVSTPPSGWSIASWLRGRLPHADLAHFACHARTDLVDPTGSRFEVSPGETVTVDQLLDGPELDSLQLVIASACQSGAPAPDAPDELLGIAYGLVHAGARGAITSTWEVHDSPAALLVARLYHEIGQHAHPATALRAAQLWLAQASNDDLGRLCDDNGPDAGWLPRTVADRLREHVVAADRDDKPFGHGSDWGTFSYLGA